MIRDGKKLPTGVHQQIPEIVRKMGEDREVVALFAFGSLARDDLKPLSDLDFGIVLNGGLDQLQRMEKHIALIGVFNDHFRTDEIDLINMNDAPDRISFQILKTGKLLVCNDRLVLIDFCERVIKQYLDFKCKRDTYDAVFLKGVGYRG
jgi:predicted nucleotidyltransferase